MELLSFDTWWEGQVVVSKIYWLITIPASFIFIVQMVLTFLKAETKTESLKTPISPNNIESILAFQLINFRNVIGFFTILGWSGLAAIDSGLSTEATILASLLCGFGMMLTMAIVFYFMGKLMNTVSEGLD